MNTYVSGVGLAKKRSDSASEQSFVRFREMIFVGMNLICCPVVVAFSTVSIEPFNRIAFTLRQTANESKETLSTIRTHRQETEMTDDTHYKHTNWTLVYLFDSFTITNGKNFYFSFALSSSMSFSIFSFFLSLCLQIVEFYFIRIWPKHSYTHTQTSHTVTRFGFVSLFAALQIDYFHWKCISFFVVDKIPMWFHLHLWVSHCCHDCHLYTANERKNEKKKCFFAFILFLSWITAHRKTVKQKLLRKEMCCV